MGPNMNKKIYPRRGLIKHGLALIGGVLVMGAGRSNAAAAKTEESKRGTRKVSRGSGVRQHCIEGERVGSSTQKQERKSLG
jgi:hypothetical protein